MLDIADFASRGITPVEKLVALAILLTLKDDADQLSFQPGPDEICMSCRIAGTWHEMVPPPKHLHPEILEVIRRLAELPVEPHRARQSWLSRLMRRPAQRQLHVESGRILFRIKSIVVDGYMKVLPAEDSERLLVELRSPRAARKAAAAALVRIIRPDLPCEPLPLYKLDDESDERRGGSSS
jgi:hypothetical protein